MEFNDSVTKLRHPFTSMVSGPTGSGKSNFVSRLIKNKESIFDVAFDKIIWLYSQFQPLYEEIQRENPTIIFTEGIPAELDDEEYINSSEKNLLVMDDLLFSANSSVKIAKLFCVGSHHRNVSIIHIIQNMFDQSKFTRTLSLNCHYLVLFKSPRDKSQISYLNRQMYPESKNFLTDAYLQATKEPWGYLLIDLKPDTPDEVRLRSNIMGENGDTAYVFLKKK